MVLCFSTAKCSSASQSKLGHRFKRAEAEILSGIRELSGIVQVTKLGKKDN